MLFVRYFAWVGAVLLVLLFVADFELPEAQPRIAPEPLQVPNIRIKSAVPSPEPVTFSGHAVDHGRPPPMEIVDLAANATDTSAADNALTSPKQAFAKATTPTRTAKSASQRPRKHYAKRRTTPRPEEPRVVEARDWWSWPRFE